eukprot:7305821-Pyramimonas_sp.AAC.1
MLPPLSSFPPSLAPVQRHAALAACQLAGAPRAEGCRVQRRRVAPGRGHLQLVDPLGPLLGPPLLR